MTKNTNPAAVVNDSTDASTDPSPTASTPAAFDPQGCADAVVAAVAAGQDATQVALLLPTGTTKRATGQRNEVLAAVAASKDPSALAVLVDAMPLAAAVVPTKTVVAAIPTDPADVLAAFATTVTFYASISGADVPRGPLAAFVAAAAKVPTKDDAGPIVASIVGRVKRGGGSQSTGTRQDRSDGRDLSRLAADTFNFRGCTAKVKVTDDGMAVTVKRGSDSVGTFPNLSAAGRAAAEADGAVKPSVNGWASWLTKDGRTADAVSRGVLAGQ